MASSLDHWRCAESALADAGTAMESGDIPRIDMFLRVAQTHAKLCEIALQVELTPGDLRYEDEWKEAISGEFY